MFIDRTNRRRQVFENLRIWANEMDKAVRAEILDAQIELARLDRELRGLIEGAG